MLLAVVLSLNRMFLYAHKAPVLCSERQAESSDDEEHFRRKEVTRLERDRAKLNPVILGRARLPDIMYGVRRCLDTSMHCIWLFYPAHAFP